jgi:hypothetical protein
MPDRQPNFLASYCSASAHQSPFAWLTYRGGRQDTLTDTERLALERRFALHLDGCVLYGKQSVTTSHSRRVGTNECIHIDVNNRLSKIATRFDLNELRPAQYGAPI